MDFSNCGTCTKLRPIKTPDSSCSKKKRRIEDVRIFCPADVSEVIVPNDDTNSQCAIGYINDFVTTEVEPLVCIDVINPDDLDELNDFSYDEDEDLGEDVYSLTPIKIKIYDADQQCTLDSLKGQAVGIVYKIVNESGDWQWRRLLMRLSTVSGGLVNGYELTFNINDPEEEEKPLFINLGDPVTTENAIDAMTNFG